MTRRAFAGMRELTPPPARLDQHSNLSSCSPHGPYEFLGKRSQFHVVHGPRPSRGAEKTGDGHMSKEQPLRQKARQMPGFSIFGDFLLPSIANRGSAVNTALVKTANSSPESAAPPWHLGRRV
jgi:hypothetical protein